MLKVYLLFCNQKLVSIHRSEQRAIAKMEYYKDNDIELYGKEDDYEIQEDYLED